MILNLENLFGANVDVIVAQNVRIQEQFEVEDVVGCYVGNTLVNIEIDSTIPLATLQAIIGTAPLVMNINFRKLRLAISP